MLLSSLAITMAQERRNATSNLERLPAFIARHLYLSPAIAQAKRVRPQSSTSELR
jgi:hypothetical protein